MIINRAIKTTSFVIGAVANPVLLKINCSLCISIFPDEDEAASPRFVTLNVGG